MHTYRASARFELWMRGRCLMFGRCLMLAIVHLSTVLCGAPRALYSGEACSGPQSDPSTCGAAMDTFLVVEASSGVDEKHEELTTIMNRVIDHFDFEVNHSLWVANESAAPWSPRLGIITYGGGTTHRLEPHSPNRHRRGSPILEHPTSTFLSFPRAFHVSRVPHVRHHHCVVSTAGRSGHRAFPTHWKCDGAQGSGRPAPCVRTADVHKLCPRSRRSRTLQVAPCCSTASRGPPHRIVLRLRRGCTARFAVRAEPARQRY